MISRCPSCGAPAPDEARQCRACGWDFIANKKGDKKPEPPKKEEPPKKTESGGQKSSAPPSPAGGLSLPPARGGSADAPATGLGMARLSKAEPVAGATPGAADENPFALPVARNLGPKPGESLFSVPPPPPEPKLPEAKPKAISEPELAPGTLPEKAAESVKPAPLRKEPARKAEEPKPAPADLPKSQRQPVDEKKVEDDNDGDSSAMFLPSSTREIVVEPEAKRAKLEDGEDASGAAKPAPAASPKAKPDASEAKEPKTGEAAKQERQSAVYLAAMAGGALGLLSIGAIFMMLRTDPQGAARPTGASPFGKRSSGDGAPTPPSDEPAAVAAPETVAVNSPPPSAPADGPLPTSIPAPAMSKVIEPPKPSAVEPAPADSPKPVPPAAVEAPPQAAVTTATPVAVQAPKAIPARPTATFAQIPRAKPVLPPPAKPTATASVPAPAPKKAAGPQWVFEGIVYDLISARGVYGARLVFVDAEDNEVASAEAGDGGQYRVSMPAGPAGGYSLRIVHDDYSGKRIDELDSTSSVRKADLEQRKFLLQAGSRNVPWVGNPGKPVRRDMALVPKVAAE